MVLTRERKILIVVLGLGLAALVADRLVLGTSATSPSTASAQQYVTMSEAQKADKAGQRDHYADSSVPKLEQMPSSGNTSQAYIAGELDLWSKSHPDNNTDSLRDVFQLPEEWSGSTIDDPSETKIRRAVEEFQSQNKLMAIMGSGKKGMAIINGKPYPVGAMIGQFQLVELQQANTVFKAVFKYMDRTVELILVNDR